MRRRLRALGRQPGLPAALVGWGIRRPVAALGLWLAIALGAGAGIPMLSIEATVESTLDRSHPAWSFYQEAQERFGGDEIVVILFQGEEPFPPSILERIAGVTEELEGATDVRRVDSLSSMPVVRAGPDGSLDLRPGYIPELAPERVARRIAADRIAPDYLVSEDGRWLAVNVLLEREGEKDIEGVLRAVEAATRGMDVHVSGVPVFRAETNRRIQRELVTFVPVTVLVIGVLLFAFFRSITAVAIPLVANGVGTWVLLGLMGLTGGALTISTAILPTLLLALGAAYTMHLLSAASLYVNAAQRNERMLAAAGPIALSGLTTAIGFVAISLVRIPVIRDVGGYGALGVVIIVGLSLTVCPAMLTLWPISRRRESLLTPLAGPIAGVLARIALQRRRPVIVAFLVSGAAASSGALLLTVESDVILWFPKDAKVRIDYEVIREALSGISPMNVVIEPSAGTQVTEPKYVRSMEELARYLEALPEVGKTISLADPLLQMHDGFAQDETFPASKALIEQYLLLLEGVEHTRDLVTDDRQSANVILRMDHNGSEHLLEVARKAQRWWAEHAPPGSSARVTGIMYEFARAESAITMGQLRGLLFATFVVGLILWISYGSLSLALTGLVPNLVPVAMGFGAMGWLDVPLDAGTALLGALVLGIAVDDTVHVLSGYQRRLQSGGSETEAVQGALREVLPPVVATTVAVGGGFAVLGLSGFLPIRHLGFLTAGILLLCLLADLLLLPVLLARRGRDVGFGRRGGGLRGGADR